MTGSKFRPPFGLVLVFLLLVPKQLRSTNCCFERVVIAAYCWQFNTASATNPYCYSLILRENLAVVFIDYLQLLLDASLKSLQRVRLFWGHYAAALSALRCS